MKSISVPNTSGHNILYVCIDPQSKDDLEDVKIYLDNWLREALEVEEEELNRR